MSKYLKSFITAFLVVCMTVCLGIFAAACTDKPNDDTNGDDNTFPSHLNVTVMLDETTPAVGVEVQPCAVKDNGKLGLCLAGVKTNAQGVASIALDEKNGNVYEIHLTPKTIPEGYAYVDADGNPYGEAGIRVDVTKNSSPTITLKSVSSTTVGTEGDPLALTLGADAVNFKVNLVKEFRPSARAEVLNWKDDYHATFTTNEAGNYKITVTVSLTDDNVKFYAAPTDDTVENIDSSTMKSNTNGNDRSLTCTLLANTEYKVDLESALDDYTSLVSSGTTSLSYSIKVEYVGEGGNDEEGDNGDEYTTDEDLTLGANKRVASSEAYYFMPESNGSYTITVDEGVTLTIGNDVIEGNTATVEYDSENPDYVWGIAIRIDKKSTITIAVAE